MDVEDTYCRGLLLPDPWYSTVHGRHYRSIPVGPRPRLRSLLPSLLIRIVTVKDSGVTSISPSDYFVEEDL